MRIISIFQQFKAFKFLELIIIFCIFYFLYNIYNYTVVGAWVNRGDFFNDGEFAPSLLDFIINEIIFSLVLFKIIKGEVNCLYFLFIIISALSYFTRVPLLLLAIAALVSPGLPKTLKFYIFLFSLIISFCILILRFYGNPISFNEVIIFYGKYLLVGIGALMGLRDSYEYQFIYYLPLFFRPLEVVTFTLDYIFNLGGMLSVGRYAGGILNEFSFNPLLDDYYNAFGTILYPYMIVFGPYLFFPVFFLSIAVQYIFVAFIFDRKIAKSYILFLLISGLIFSWNSPFIWIAPFLVKLLEIKYIRA